MMWVFGYGSLMWDKWETAHGCTRKELADLTGHCRVFNKASIKNWGTKDAPCLTLNLWKKDAGVCRGIAFEFPDNKKEEVLTYLKKREGEGFVLRKISVLMQGTTEVSAIVSIYEGQNLINAKAVSEVASCVAKAMGTKGSCLEYVKGVAEKLTELGIDDPVVTEFWGAVKADA